MALATPPAARLGEGLDRRQLEAVSAARGPLCVLAGAGAGKTRVLTRRVAWMALVEEIEPRRILAVSFTNQAVDEMRERLGVLVGHAAAAELECATFHAAAWRLVVRPYARLYERPVRVIYSAEDALSACRRALADAGAERRASEVLGRIGWAKAQRLTPAALRARGEGDREVAAIWLRYRAQLRAAGALDFEDLLAAAVWLLEERAQVREAIQGRFSAVLVDEYQDASAIQQRWVELVAGHGVNLTVVGDDDQSVYRWRGADARALVGFEADFAAAGARRVVLGRNYRSREVIVAAAARLIAHNPDRPAKELRAQSAGGVVEFRLFADEAAEAEGVAAWVAARLESETPAGEIAVLARTARYLGRVEQLLATRGMRYEVLGRLRLAEHAEVRDVLALVSAARYPHHREALARAARRVSGLGVRSLERVFAQAQRERRSPLAVISDEARLDREISGRARAGCAELGARVRGVDEGLARGLRAGVVQAIRRSGWATELAADAEEARAEARRERLRLVAELAERLEAEGERDAEALLVSLVLRGAGEREAGGVALATIHAAKGREWRRVALIGLAEGHLPHHRALAEGGDALAAERCAAYVAMTRAREELCVSAAERVGRPPRQVAASRFITEAGLR